MELCPRCASTVADSAQSCGGCGAPLWQPTAREPVAVTPVPVALVLPVAPPAATPPPLPAQRVASPELSEKEPPPPAPVNPSVLPAAQSSHHWAAGVASVSAVFVVVALIVALPARGAKPTARPPAVATSEDAQLDLRALAAAEETSLTATRVYTTSSTALAASGYQPTTDAPVTILAGVHRRSGYCLVATAGGSNPWYLYDSKQGGLVNDSFDSQTQAQQACADTAIATYVSVS